MLLGNDRNLWDCQEIQMARLPVNFSILLSLVVTFHILLITWHMLSLFGKQGPLE